MRAHTISNARPQKLCVHLLYINLYCLPHGTISEKVWPQVKWPLVVLFIRIILVLLMIISVQPCFLQVHSFISSPFSLKNGYAHIVLWAYSPEVFMIPDSIISGLSFLSSFSFHFPYSSGASQKLYSEMQIRGLTLESDYLS